jgi:hypothetical protein
MSDSKHRQTDGVVARQDTAQVPAVKAASVASKCRHAGMRAVGRHLAAHARVAAAGVAVVGGAVGGIAGAGASSASTTYAPATYQVVHEQTAVPSGYNLDVASQTAAPGTRIIEWRAGNDPAEDFALVPAGRGGVIHQLAYVPFGSLTNAKAQPAGYQRTQAILAYDSDGTARYCVEADSVTDGNARLEACASTASVADAGQFFAVVAGVDPGHATFQPTYADPGSSPGPDPMALNDAGYGKDGSPIVSWPVNTGQNEEFYTAG